MSGTRERETYSDSSVSGFVKWMENNSTQELLEKKVKYHKSCYSSFANADNVSRAQRRFRDSIKAAKGSVIKKKAGRPSTVLKSDRNQEKIITRSQTTPDNKDLRIICQTPGKNIYKISTNDTGELMLKISETFPDENLFRRLNSIASAKDAVAFMSYTIICVGRRLNTKPLTSKKKLKIIL